MTNKIINILILVNFTVFCYAQNIGQNDDTLVNYIDINGLKQGYWQKDYYNGNIKYKGYFKNDKLVGEFKRYSNKGKLMAILFYDETGDTANAKIFHENSKLAASGIYIMKIKYGNWQYYNENGLLLLEESYNSGVKHGLSKQYYLNGSLYKEIEYKDGKINGISKRYYTNGNINFFINYKDGLCQGDYYIYFESGKIEIKGKYNNDLKNGKWYYYKENGSLIREVEYINGKAENQDELDIIETEILKKLDDNKGKILDPEDFTNSPEEYLFNKNRY